MRLAGYINDFRYLIFEKIPAASKNGTCYEDALNYFTMNSIKNKKLRLVHGLVVGQGPIEGVVYGHAWVEDGSTVIDATKRPILKLPKKLYYTIGQIKKNTIFRYDRKQVSDKMDEYQTYGPWEGVLLSNKY